MPLWQMRPHYFRGKGFYKFDFTPTDQPQMEVGVEVDESGRFDLSPSQFSLINTIGVYARPME